MLTFQRTWFSALLAPALVAVAFAAAPVHAQGIPDQDLFDDFDDGGVASRTMLSIQNFTLAGNGCPERGSVSATIEPRGQTSLLRIDFTKGDGRRFQANGPGEATQNCTVRLQLSANSDRRFTVSLREVSEGVRFVNESDRGQLTVRSQFQLNGDVSAIRALRLQNDQDARASNFLLDGFDVRTRVTRMLDVRAIVQLQLQGQNEAMLRLESVTLTLQLEEDRNGAAAEDPFVRRPARGNDRDREAMGNDDPFDRRGARGNDDGDPVARRRNAGDDEPRERRVRRNRGDDEPERRVRRNRGDDQPERRMRRDRGDEERGGRRARNRDDGDRDPRRGDEDPGDDGADGASSESSTDLD